MATASPDIPLTGTSGGSRSGVSTTFNVFQNGLGIVPRRGFDPVTASLLKQAVTNPIAALSSFTQTHPNRLLQIMFDMHPLFGLARSNDLSLAFSPGDTHFVATELVNGTQQINEKGTAALDKLWDDLPAELGGLEGLQATLYDQAMTCGLVCVEAVAGPRGSGIVNIIPFDPLTCRYFDTSAGRVFQQRQGGLWKTLDPDFCFNVPLHGSRDNPYGRPGKSQALSEGLRDLRDNGLLDEVFEQVALPRISMGFPFMEIMEYAKLNPQLLQGQGPVVNGKKSDLTAAQFTMLQFEQFGEKAVNQYDKRIFVRMKGAEAQVLSGADALAALDGTMERRRLRLIQGLDQLPTLMGVDPGGTLAFSSTQWRAQAKKLESIRGFINKIIARVLNLHLLWSGMDMKARADVEPIQTSDVFVDEQARQLKIANEERLIALGWISNDEGSINVTGSGPVGEPDPEKLRMLVPPKFNTKQQDDSQDDQQDNPPQPPQKKQNSKPPLKKAV